MLSVVVVAMVVSVAAAAPQKIGKSVVPATGPAEQVWPPLPYSYQYEIKDEATNNFQNRYEMKTETGAVYGSWSVMMPDGYIYTTTYNVTGPSGFLSNMVRSLPTPLTNVLTAARAETTATTATTAAAAAA